MTGVQTCALPISYLRIANDAELERAIGEAHRLSAGGRPVVVDIAIDYTKRTAFTKGAVKTNFKRFPLRQRLRVLGRALARRVTG